MPSGSRPYSRWKRRSASAVVRAKMPSARGSGSGSLVLGEVYAAGGNSGAAYANDYAELFNRGASPR